MRVTNPSALEGGMAPGDLHTLERSCQARLLWLLLTTHCSPSAFPPILCTSFPESESSLLGDLDQDANSASIS